MNDHIEQLAKLLYETDMAFVIAEGLDSPYLTRDGDNLPVSLMVEYPHLPMSVRATYFETAQVALKGRYERTGASK